MTKILIEKYNSPLRASIVLPASKSISNRALIINALSKYPGQIGNLSEARDTQTMHRLLSSNDHLLDVIDAGTTMRFLTAYLSITNQDRVLTGTERMCDRPIKILVDALRTLGASIDYESKDGYPPIHVKGFKDLGIRTLKIRGDISSQYISALLMVAPLMQNGLQLELTGAIGSRPYISMTLKIMENFGVQCKWSGTSIQINPGTYVSTKFTVEPDWSAASYWYSIAALGNKPSIQLKGLTDESLQGDQAIVEIMHNLGVQTSFDVEGASLSSRDAVEEVVIDFKNCPDLAQTVAVVCAAKGIKGRFTGLESLKIKETDRVSALQNELAKFGAKLMEDSSGWTLIPGKIVDKHYAFDTYDDHRMAMAFAPLATLANVTINNPSVVSKSYPGYWEDYRTAGFLLR